MSQASPLKIPLNKRGTEGEAQRSLPGGCVHVVPKPSHESVHKALAGRLLFAGPPCFVTVIQLLLGCLCRGSGWSKMISTFQ